MSLVEVMICAVLLMLTSMSLVYAYSSAGLASRLSDRSTAVQTSLEQVAESIADLPFDSLLSQNGRAFVEEGGAKDHTVLVSANLVEVGLVMVELTVVDNQSNAVLARIATYRSGDA